MMQRIIAMSDARPSKYPVYSGADDDYLQEWLQYFKHSVGGTSNVVGVVVSQLVSRLTSPLSYSRSFGKGR
jgi:hypothetical protein